MKTVAADLNKVKGLKAAYIRVDGYAVESTFADNKQHEMQELFDFVEQYFFAAEGIDKSYNEFVFSISNHENLVAYQLDKSALVVMITEHKINLPMLHMNLKMVIKNIREDVYNKSESEPSKIVGASASASPTPTPETSSDPGQDFLERPTISLVEKTPATKEVQETPEKEERFYTMYRGQRVYRDKPTRTAESAIPKKSTVKKRVYRGQEI